MSYYDKPKATNLQAVGLPVHISDKHLVTEPIEGSARGTRTRHDGTYTHADVIVYVDVEALARSYGYRALRSSRGRAVLAHGCIRIVATKRQNRSTP